MKRCCVECKDPVDGKYQRCDACRKVRVTEQSLRSMRKLRSRNAEYREDERVKVRARMRKARARLHKNGLNNNGLPYGSSNRAKMARRFSRAMMGTGFPNSVD